MFRIFKYFEFRNYRFCKYFLLYYNLYIYKLSLAFSGEELGRSVVLKKCDETAVDDFYMNVSCTPQPDALNPCEDIVRYQLIKFAAKIVF